MKFSAKRKRCKRRDCLNMKEDQEQHIVKRIVRSNDITNVASAS